MRPSLAGGALAVILLIALVVAYSTFFNVYQTRQALVVRLGNPVRVITEPGLNAKIPFIDSVIYIDKRILAIESPAQEVIASSQDKANAGVAQAGERLVVDAFARYRITDQIFRDVEPEDLLKYGLIPEFVGRLPVVATLEDLDEASLKLILTQPKNALVKQYQRLFEMEGVDLTVAEEALGATVR